MRNDEGLMKRLANRCASTWLAYLQAEATRAAIQDALSYEQCGICWSEHDWAVFQFRDKFPDDDWERIAEPEMMHRIEARE